MCLLADLCNHTWIPECGRERDEGTLRLFIDECDLYEYSCDYNYHFEIMNYSDCFSVAPSCPTTIPCPSHPTCPNHAFHRMGQRYVYITDARRMIKPPVKSTTKINLPKHMLKGKRRYTPIPRCQRGKLKAAQKTTIRRTIPKNRNLRRAPNVAITKEMTKKTTIRETMILKRETVVKDGKVFVKIVKAYAPRKVTAKYIKEDSDFLEK